MAGLLRRAEEDLIVGRRYPMQTGEHTNYWPYWNNYLAPLRKLLAQTPVGSEAFLLVKNRIEDILNHKTVLTGTAMSTNRTSVSISGALVQRRTYGRGPGQRVSLASGSRPQRPIYEVLNLAVTGLPAEHQSLSGLPVVRYPDGSLRFDWQGPGVLPVRWGKPLPPALANYLTAQRVPAAELGVRGSSLARRRGPASRWTGTRTGASSYRPSRSAGGGTATTKLRSMPWASIRSAVSRCIGPSAVTICRARAMARRGNDRCGRDGHGGAADLFGRRAVGCRGCADLGSRGRLCDSRQPAQQDDAGRRDAVCRQSQQRWSLAADRAERRPSSRIRVDAEVKQLWHKSDASKNTTIPRSVSPRSAH